jgi:hypothetical protein
MDKKSLAVPKAQGDVRELLRGIGNTFVAESLAELSELLSPDFEVDENRMMRVLDHGGRYRRDSWQARCDRSSQETPASVECAEEVDVPAVKGLLQEFYGGSSAGI